MNAPAAFPALDVRAQFPGVGEWHYLDSAATAQKPQAVIDAIARAYGENYATVHRGVYDRSATMSRSYEEARARTARFIGAKTDELVFVRGATEAINLVAATWGEANIGKDDVIVLSRLEHHSNLVPWQMLAERVGARIEVLDLDGELGIDLDRLEDIVDERVKLVALSHLSNVTGASLDAPRAARIAHEVGAKLLLDGCQAAPRMRVDVAELDCDFYAFSGHKLYGPTGIGGLFVRAEILTAMPPYQGGGSMIDTVRLPVGTSYAPAPTRFEAGTPHIVGAIGLAAAIDWVEAVGIDAIHAHEARLADRLREGLRDRPGVTLFSAPDSAGIVTFTMDCAHAHDVATILDDDGVAVRAGHFCCQPLMDYFSSAGMARASFAAHSDEGDVEALLRGIEKVKRIFG